MLVPGVTHVLLLVLVALSILLMLIRPGGIAEVYWVSGGAVLLLLFRLISPAVAGRAVAEGADVYLFLLGMMLLSALAAEYGVFEWVSSVAVRSARGSASRLFGLIYGIGVCTTVFLSNDATAVVLTPAILSAVRKAKVEPLPHLFACALVANAASFVLPISNPANLVVFQQRLPPLGRWLLMFGLPSLFSIGITYVALRVLFRRELGGAVDEGTELVPLTPAGRWVLGGLSCVVVVLLITSALNGQLGLPTCLAAVAVAAAISVKERQNPVRLIREISWGTLVLVAGLFVMVRAVEGIGALRVAEAALQRAASMLPAVGVLATGFAVGIANNLVNNLPLGLIAGGALQGIHPSRLVSDAVLIGVDLGPNFSITGSLATILWLLALRKEKIEVSFLQFLRVGAIAMPAALLASLGSCLLMQAISGGK